MQFDDILAQVLELLQREKRLSYRALKRRFAIDDEYLEDLKAEIIDAKHLAMDEGGKVLVWTGGVATMSTEPAASLAERRQLTVMFCDLIDSTALAARLDPEDLRELIRAYQSACSVVIQRFDGYIAQHLGDGLLVYFGYPQAHEDDAHRAVHTGLGIVQAMAALQEQVAQESGVTLAVRVGIHTGLVVVGEVGTAERHEQLALGETPNLAARLQGLATPNTVVISAATYRLVQGFFTCSSLGPQTLRGLQQPLVVYRVVQESGLHTRLETASPSALLALIGREPELRLLVRYGQQACDGTGQAVLLNGEAGIGKSRLVEALWTHLERMGYRRLTLRCSPYYQQSALYPLIDLLQRLLQLSSKEDVAQKWDRLETLLQQAVPSWHEVLPLFAALLAIPLPPQVSPAALSPQQQKQHTHRALVAWLCALAVQQPVYMVWEDLHWADPSTLEVLQLLLAQVPAARLLTVLTCRPDFQALQGQQATLQQLTLDRLPPEQVHALVLRVTGDKPLPPDIVAQIIAKTDGIPLFVEELTKAVVESGMLHETPTEYTLLGPLPELAIPATLHDSLMARLDRLVTAKGVAQLGATIGRQFSYELLHAVSQLDDTTLQRELQRLVDAELLYPQGLPPQRTYVFKHALIQDTAYQSLLKSTRQQYHQRLAQVLVEQFPETAAAHPELVAQHYTEAGMAASAVDYWQRAGERADARSAYAEASAHFARALAVVPSLAETPQRLQHALLLQTALCWSLQATKGYAAPEVEQAYARALTLCQQGGLALQHVPVLLGCWALRVVRAELHTAQQLAEQLLRLIQGLAEPSWLTLPHMALGYTLFCRGEFVAAGHHLQQGLALYHPQTGTDVPLQVGGVQDPKMMCHAYLARVLWLLGYPQQALQHSVAALAHARQLGHPFTLMYAQIHNIAVYRWRGELQQAHEITERVRMLANMHGVADRIAESTFRHGVWRMGQGQTEVGEAQALQGLQAYRATGAGISMPSHLCQLAEAYQGVGKTAAALQAVEEALRLVDRTGERWWEAELYRLKGELLLAQAKTRGQNAGEDPAWGEGEGSLQHALAIARTQQAKSLELRAAISLSRLWQQQGRHDAAVQLLTPILAWFTEGFDTADLQTAKALLQAPAVRA